MTLHSAAVWHRVEKKPIHFSSLLLFSLLGGYSERWCSEGRVVVDGPARSALAQALQPLYRINH